MINITINGELKQFKSPLNIEELLKTFSLEPKYVVVEKNLTIIPKENFQNEIVNHNDKLEIVSFVGGG